MYNKPIFISILALTVVKLRLLKGVMALKFKVLKLRTIRKLNYIAALAKSDLVSFNCIANL